MVSLGAGLLALVSSTLARRGPDRLPIITLIRERFATLSFSTLLTGLLTGTIVIFVPLMLATSLGWLQLYRVNAITETGLWLGMATVLVKFGWAALEELIFRGAILPQVARRTNGLVGLAVSALLFAWGHLERSETRTPDRLSLLVFALDGIGFGVAYLATKSLWLPTVWHATKNSWVWLLFGTSTIQLTPGLFQAHFSGPPLWVGTPEQAGLLDVMSAVVVVVTLVALYKQQLRHGLTWISRQ